MTAPRSFAVRLTPATAIGAEHASAAGVREAG
jgi:hypothetical protein